MRGTINIISDTRNVRGSITHYVPPERRISNEEKEDAKIEANKLVGNWSTLLSKNGYTNIETFPEHYSGDWKNAEILNHINWHGGWPPLFSDGKNFEITVPLAAAIFWKDDSDGIEVEKHIGRGDISLQNANSEIDFVWNNKQYFISPTTEIALIGDARNYLSKLKHRDDARSGGVKINNRNYGASSFTDDDVVYREFVYCLHGGDIFDVITDTFRALKKKVAIGV